MAAEERISAWIAHLGAPAFRRIYRFDRALRAKLTGAGWLLAALLVASMVFGLNTRESLLYQLFALAVGLFVVAAVAAWRLPLRVRVARHLPRVATAGEPFDYCVTVTNQGAALRPLLVEDLLELPRVDRAAFARYKVAADRGRNIFDRLVGYPRWVAFMRQRIGARVDTGKLAGLAPDGEAQVRLRCRPERRGVLRFQRLRFSHEEPLGLMKALAVRPCAETLVVLPRTFAMAPVDLPGARRLQPGGVPFASHVGDAEEFMSLRDYRDGDGPRRIHWKAWARTGRMVVKEYQDEFFVRHALLLDTFGARNTECFEAAVSLAASVVLQPRASDALLDLMFVEGRAYTFTQGRGLGAPAELLRVLATVSDGKDAGFEALAESVLLATGRLSGVLCVLLHWDERRRHLVMRLQQRGLPLRVWVVHDGDALPDPGPMLGDTRNFRVVHPRRLAQQLRQP